MGRTCRVIALGVSVLLCSSFYRPAGEQGSWRFQQVQFYSGGSHLGVGLTDIDPDRASILRLGEPRGAEVRTVQENSPAQAAGLQPGDVLLTYNGEDILSASQLGRLVNETPPGRRVNIQYWRGGKTATASVVLSAPVQTSNDEPRQLQRLPSWGVPDFPRMLMLWENVSLGIECEPLDEQIAGYFGVQDGILIRSVAKGYPGEKGGLRAGDVITSIDTRSVAGPRDLISYLRMQHTAKTLSIAVVRDHKTRTLSIALNE